MLFILASYYKTYQFLIEIPISTFNKSMYIHKNPHPNNNY